MFTGMKKLSIVLLLAAACLAMPVSGMASGKQLQDPTLHRGHTTALIADEVRHQLVTLPYYDVFDWLEAEVLPDDTVILSGQVTRPTLKSDAEARVRSLESVAKVVNKIEVLPLSTMDDEIRLATYRAIFSYNSPLFRYSVRAVPPIHIVVKNGHVTLKGIVANAMDRQLAYMAARNVPGVFSVDNKLMVENNS
ncbi:MAG TPA: BON domain-containing protein [Terriglobia bacterium]|nr:BON domain-containing protein [Terriglobia bacterium]